MYEVLDCVHLFRILDKSSEKYSCILMLILLKHIL